MTASCNILMDRRTKPLSLSSRKYNLLRPCTSLILIRVSSDAISHGSRYRRQKSSTESFPPYPGTSRPGRRRRESLKSTRASCSSSSVIFRGDITAHRRRPRGKSQPQLVAGTNGLGGEISYHTNLRDWTGASCRAMF
jgi:hypothetical protein